MSSSHQLHVYRSTDFSASERRVIDFLRDHPGSTRAQIAEGMASGQKSSVSGRVAALLSKGCLISQDAAGGERLTYDPHESNWLPRARRYEKAKELKDFAAAAELLKPHLPGPVVENLRRIYASMRSAS
jgi:hypothetical protein